MAKMLSTEFLKNLPDDSGQAILRICHKIIAFDESMTDDEEKMTQYGEYLKGASILTAFLESKGIKFEPVDIPSGDNLTDTKRVRSFADDWKYLVEHGRKEQFFADSTEKYRKMFGKAFLYTFSDGDLKRVQTLLNEIREVLTGADWLEDGHKRRLLKRLEKLQSELHKSVSDLDRFWGLVVEASIVLKKVGENAKPLVDRVREIMQIVWGVQIRAEELPSNETLQLELKEDE